MTIPIAPIGPDRLPETPVSVRLPRRAGYLSSRAPPVGDLWPWSALRWPAPDGRPARWTSPLRPGWGPSTGCTPHNRGLRTAPRHAPSGSRRTGPGTAHPPQRPILPRWTCLPRWSPAFPLRRPLGHGSVDAPRHSSTAARANKRPDHSCRCPGTGRAGPTGTRIRLPGDRSGTLSCLRGAIHLSW